MLIDWFTVIAQAVNFLILVWLLKRFLYAPILNAIDSREKRIAAELAEADANRLAATAVRDEFRLKLDEFDAQRTGLFNSVKVDAAAQRQQLLESARSEADRLRQRQQQQLLSEYRSLSDELGRRTQREVFAVARKVLTDLAGVGLEERMVEVFVQRLQALDVAVYQDMAALSSPVLIRSAFELSPKLRARIEAAVQTVLGRGLPVGFEIVPDLISGIELVTQGRKIAWSVADYLSALENDVNALIKVQSAGDSGQK